MSNSCLVGKDKKKLEVDDDDRTLFAQAEGITIEPLANSTDEEYDEYYDIWEGKISNRTK